MKAFKYIIMWIFLLMIQPAIALEDSNNLNEEIVKNFTYHLKYSEQTVTLKNGKYETPLRPGNKEDMENYLSVKIEKYGIFKPKFLPPFAIVILSENFGGSGVFFEITALVKEDDKIVQTNSIELGDRVVIKDLRFQPGFVYFQRDFIYLSLLTHKGTDPSCCPTKQEILCFTLVRDENKEMKLLTCEEAEENYPLPAVKKPALYLYPNKTEKVEVILKPKGQITKTIPEYKDKWLVIANPNGLIDNKYPYLFYEVALENSIDLPKEGWIVKTTDLEKWFDVNLPKLGLNEKEIKDFKEYWLGELKGYPYYKIRLLSEEFLDENIAVKINPRPDTFIRVIFYFEGTYDSKEKLIEPQIKTHIRKGFTAVEWGGILGTSNKSDIKSVKYSFFPTEEGILVLSSLNIEDHKIKIKVNTNGCTDKNSIKAVVKKSTRIDPRVPDYEITFIREKPDSCKAFIPDGAVIEYDLKRDFNIQMPYTLKIGNPVMPFTKDEPYFTIGKVERTIQEEPIEGELLGTIQEMMTEIRRDVKNATIYAIQKEIERYKKRGEKEKVKKLENELKEIKQIKDEDFQIPENAQEYEPESKDLSFGPIYPCKAIQTEIIAGKRISIGDILNVKGMTRSGPFYHIAGIRKDVLENMKAGKIYKANLCLVYKREYFGFIPDYYIYLADVEE
ncbi:hypothetical protein [Sulfurihydrogenibium sp.]|uniref:hypothetical protein n=1 Tax=Sulfurihydrogenibium sp. TaxID=2053621 RepID=UPI002604B5F3|nr:hypothetical protein [Sulfurihydrogenibium sp.]